MKLEYLFYILAVVLIGAAAFLLAQKYTDWGFAAGVLAACAYFIGMRFRIKARMTGRENEAPAKGEEE